MTKKRGVWGVFFVLLVVIFVYFLFLGVFDSVHYNEKYFENMSFVKKNDSSFYSNGFGLSDLNEKLNSYEVEGVSYVFSENYSGIFLDRVYLSKINKIDFDIEMVLEGDYLVYEFPYKNKMSFYLGRYKFGINLEDELDRRGYVLRDEFVIYDSIEEKLIYVVSFD